MTLIPIGRFAKVSRLSVKSLRNYDQSGLLPAAFVDPQTSYRYYRLEQLARADAIRSLRMVDMPLHSIEELLDGDDPEQLAWATRRYASTKAKLILVRGAPLELMKARQRRFYFDQGGSLVKHFGIRAVPATVEQQGRVLIITEQPVRPKERASS